MDNHIPEHEQRSAVNVNAQGRTQWTHHSDIGSGSESSGQHRANGDTAETAAAEAVVSHPAALQQPMQSPFGMHQPNFQEDAINENLKQATRKTPQDRWRDAGKKITGKGTIRFGADTVEEPSGPSSDDTAHINTPLGPPPLERKSSSLLGRSSLGPRISSTLNLTKLGKSFKDNRAGNSAMADTVKLAQQQQQANRQSAAPVLKAVPSTKVTSYLQPAVLHQDKFY